MADQKPVTVTVLKHHQWRGEDKNPGDTYDVVGDASQTTEQYLDTLRGTGFALPVDDASVAVGPASAVAPLSTENISKPEATPVAATSAAVKPTAAKKAQPAKPGGKKK